MTISEGLEGGSDPPAFQAAERERMAKASAEENTIVSVVAAPSQRLNDYEQSYLLDNLLLDFHFLANFLVHASTCFCYCFYVQFTGGK